MIDFAWLASPDAWLALITLTVLEIVLGIDNIIFISILTNKLPEQIRGKARSSGIGLALVLRIAMLLGITWIIQFQEPIFTVFDTALSGRDLILLSGGLFLIFKSTREIHHKVSPDDDSQYSEPGKTARKGLLYIIIQIGILDIVFSFDSILTAIGMVQELSIMIMAVIVSLVVMLAFSGPIARLVETHPTLQMLALSFLILIGFVLIADGLHQHISKGYIYVAVVFSLTVEVLNIQDSKRKSAQSQK